MLFTLILNISDIFVKFQLLIIGCLEYNDTPVFYNNVYKNATLQEGLFGGYLHGKQH